MTLVKSTGNKKVNLDFNKEFINTFSEKIQTSDIKFINQTLKDLHESDIANLIENLSSETRTKLIEIEEFKIDGIRWDLTKGFTQNCNENDASCTDSFQQDRVDLLKKYADYSWSLDPDHYVIFEHLGSDEEEREWANYRVDEDKGVMLWGKMTNQFNQLTMGFADGSGISRIDHRSRGFNANRLIGYAESHDEERLMYKNIKYGNSSNSNHDVKILKTSLKRMNALGSSFILSPCL